MTHTVIPQVQAILAFECLLLQVASIVILSYDTSMSYISGFWTTMLNPETQIVL